MADPLVYRNMTAEESDEDDSDAYGEQRHASSSEILTNCSFEQDRRAATVNMIPTSLGLAILTMIMGRTERS